MGRTVPVSLYQPKPDPLQDILARHTSENTLVLKELPASVNDAFLALHIEVVTGLSDETDFNLDRKGDTALIQLNRSKFGVLEFYPFVLLLIYRLLAISMQSFACGRRLLYWLFRVGRTGLAELAVAG